MFSYLQGAVPIILKGCTRVSVLFKWHHHGIVVTLMNAGHQTAFCLHANEECSCHQVRPLLCHRPLLPATVNSLVHVCFHVLTFLKSTGKCQTHWAHLLVHWSLEKGRYNINNWNIYTPKQRAKVFLRNFRKVCIKNWSFAFTRLY